jgi:lipopolysaccharide export LptBFGC system permease protein LptF
MTTSTYSNFSEKWSRRFAFFDQHGAPSAATFKAALLELGHAERIKVSANIWAFFFGPLYLVVLGLWKKALVLCAIAFTLMALTAVVGLPESVQMGISIGTSMLFAFTTNYAYYLKRVKGQDGWNAFEGIGW